MKIQYILFAILKLYKLYSCFFFFFIVALQLPKYNSISNLLKNIDFWKDSLERQNWIFYQTGFGFFFNLLFFILLNE